MLFKSCGIKVNFIYLYSSWVDEQQQIKLEIIIEPSKFVVEQTSFALNGNVVTKKKMAISTRSPLGASSRRPIVR